LLINYIYEIQHVKSCKLHIDETFFLRYWNETVFKFYFNKEMITKVAHYSGFQSYGDLPYPSLKPGKKTLESNTIFQESKFFALVTHY